MSLTQYQADLRITSHRRHACDPVPIVLGLRLAALLDNINDENENCECPLTKAECLQTVKSMEPDKTPGTDGLPIDFYKVSFSEMTYSIAVVNSINYAFEKG